MTAELDHHRRRGDELLQSPRRGDHGRHGDHLQPPAGRRQRIGSTSAIIARGSIKPAATTTTPGGSPTSCQVDLTLTRRVEGTLEKAFKDGSIAAESRSVLRIVSAP